MGAGPIDVEVLRPQELRLTVAPGEAHGFSADLIFTCTVPASLEAHHLSRPDGRVSEDYSRFDQIGSVSGWIKLGDEHIAVKDWFASRDHSWGIRTGMGG